MLADTTASAVAMLEPVQHAAVTLTHTQRTGRPTLTSTAATDTVAERFDKLQHTHRQGPCFEAAWESGVVVIRDMTTEQRWPELVDRVTAELPIRSTMSIQLWVTDNEMGALNLHSDQVDAFDFDTGQLALNLATHAAIALSGARRDQQFRSALASRDIIGQAKGMLMERFDIDAVSAFELLKRLSQDTNAALRDVATQLVDADHPTPPAQEDLSRPGERP
ncbi:GAF and ANTAR domain-containing protein [Williamsia serinedens]|nr:GAF and ANTAR domain-containing protein [Williamsia serinedens]